MTLSLLSILYFIAFSHAAMITIVLWRRSNPEAPGRLLAVITALMAYKLFEGGAFHSRLVLEIPHAVNLLPNMVLILGPVFYGYVRRMTGQTPLTTRMWALHLLPALVSWLYYSPDLFQSAELKIAMWTSVRTMGGDHVVAMPEMLQLLVIKALLTTYLVLSWRSLGHFSKAIDQLRADNSRDILSQLRFLALSFILLEIVWISMFLAQQFFGGVTLSQVGQVWLLFTAMIVLAIGYLGLQKPNFLLTQEECSLAAVPAQPNQDETDENAISGEANVKYIHSALPESAASEIAQLIEQCLEDEALYLDEKLTLTKLSRAIDIKSHTVSQVINQHMRTNFYRLINGCRIQYALTLIEDLTIHFPLERIALESGFGNRVTFNKAFKEHMSCTASEYRNKLRQVG